MGDATTRVLVGDSVFESAALTAHDGRLYIEFEADDLDDITVDISAIQQAIDATGGQDGE